YTEQLFDGYDNGFHGDGEPLALASMTHARGVALDAQGNVYIADTDAHRVRKITAINGVINPEESIITTIAGNGQWYSEEENVPATSTALSFPEALAIDAAGNVYVHERGSNRVRRISVADGTISTYAGGAPWGYTGDGGPATEAHIELINGNIVLDAASNLYLAEMGANRLRRVNAATGIIDTVLGNGTMTFCKEVSPRREACLGGPQGVAVDAGGNVYISDSRNLRIRRIDASTGELRTIAGNSFGYTHGGDGGPATAASFAAEPGGISFDSAGNLLIAGSWANNVRRIDMTTGIITTIAGTGVQGFAGDGGPATAARFASVQDVVADAAGNLYLSDSYNYRIRKISAAGIVSTIAGNGINAFGGDGGPATAASLQWATDIRVDAAGNVFFADNARIRRIDAATGIIRTVAGNGGNWSAGEGVPATYVGIGWSFAFDLDGSGNIIINTGNYLRRVDAVTGLITSVGSSNGMNTPDGIGIQSPAAMKFGLGGLFVTDDNSDLVFRIDGVPSGGPDTTPPVITYVVNGIAGVEDWYRSDVTVTFTVSDPESPILSMSGCHTRSLTHDTTGGAFICRAGSIGGESSRSVTIRRDTVAPVVTPEVPSPPDAYGWYNRYVTLWFYTSDALSGVYSSDPDGALYMNQEGTGLTGQAVVTDRAGNTTTYTSPPINIDLYPPAVASSRPGETGNNGWYTTDVPVDWSIWEPISPIRSSEGCDDFVLSTDTPGTTFSCTATSAGGTLTGTLTLKRDATPPTLVFGSPSPAPNASGWHNGDVSFPFTTSDGTSGVASTSSSGPVVITGEGAGLTATVTVTDAAGNSATFTTPPVNINRAPPPTVTPVVTGTPGNNGWYRSNVQLSWTLTGDILSSTGCGNSSVTSDTAGETFTCSATSAGGTASSSVTIKRDVTAPTLTFGTRTPAANSRGWNNTNVSFPFTTADALSGVASTSSPSPVVITGSGVGLTGQVTVSDAAGNSAVFTSAAVNIDRTVAVITPNIVGTLGTNGWYRSNVQVSWTIDELPGSIDWTSGCGTTNRTTDTTGVSYSCGVQSAAGYTSRTVSIKRDATAPVVTITRPANNATYTVGQSVTSSFGCTDARMQSCVGTTTNGAPLDTSSAGTKSFTVNALDLAGNTTTLVRTYTVQ
ncbi:MAG TPA: hypothetical protein VIV63_06465, partial [Steroidobacteraceae bacterium]